jgi:hypothetical protein
MSAVTIVDTALIMKGSIAYSVNICVIICGIAVLVLKVGEPKPNQIADADGICFSDSTRIWGVAGFSQCRLVGSGKVRLLAREQDAATKV